MKFAFLGTAYPMRGGIAQFNALLVSELREQHEVDVYSFTRQYPNLFFPGKTQIESGEDPRPINATAMVDTVNPFTWYRTAGEIARGHPDALLFKYWMPFFAPCFGTVARRVKHQTRKAGKETRVILICDNIIPHETRLFDHSLTKYMLNTTDAFIVMSKSVEEDLRRFRPDAPAELVTHPLYTHFGEPMPKDEARSSLGWDQDKKILLFFGYIRAYKGLNDLLRAMPNIHEETGAHLVVLGEFYEDRGPYDRLISELGISEIVQMSGDYVPNEEVAVQFAASDLVVLPYRSATQSGIVQVAYQLERPVLSTRVGGLEEMITDDETGLLIPPDDQGALVEAIRRYFAEELEEKLTAGLRREKVLMGWGALADAVVRLAAGS